MKALYFQSKNLISLMLILFLGVIKVSGANFVVTKTTNQPWCCPSPAINDGTLYGAIMGVNASAGPHTISFNLTGTGPFTIDLTNLSNSNLTLNNQVTIDGLTQSGSSCSNLQIIFSGPSLALTLNATTGSIIKGIVFQGVQVNISGGSANSVYNCYFNLNAAGTAVAGSAPGNWPNAFVNVSNSPSSIIGGNSCSTRNIFSGNNASIGVLGSNSSGLTVLGNYFGTDVTGLVTAGSGFTGDAINVTSCSGAKIENNTIAGNVASGVNLITSNSSSISDNKIGIAINGTTKIGTGFTGTAGIVINNSQSVNVDTNTVVGGVYSSTNENGQGFGIYSTGTNCSSLNIRGNLIGVQSNGLTASNLGNGRNGIKISGGASGINILNNIVCNNGIQDNKSNSSGIYVETNGSTISNLTISGNNIGVDKAYSKAGNIFAGLYLRVVSGGSISTVSLTNNVIGDNGNSAPNANLPAGYSSGIAFLDCPNVNATITGNYIGMTPSGSDIGNYHNGIEISNTSNVTVGGTNTSLRNYFGYNKAYRQTSSAFGAGDLYGAALMINSSGSTNIKVIGNYFGVTPGGTSAGQVNAGSGHAANNGIVVESASNVQIGGTNAGEPNTIANMGTDGILVINAADFVQIRQNSIYCNGGKGINLNLASSTYASKTPGNNSYAAPVITTPASSLIGANTVSGTCPSGAIVEVFYDADGACARACSDPNKRQGKVFLGIATTSGTTWTYTQATNFTNEITATATGVSGGNYRTSEFSTCNPQCASTITSGTAAVCTGTTVTYSTTDATGPYNWVVSGGTIISGSGTQSISVTFTTAGSQTVKLTSGSCTQATYNVTVNGSPTLSVGSSSIDICNGQSTNLTASATGGTSAYTFTWSPSTGLSSTTGTPVTANPITTTTYTVTVTDAKGCTDPNGSKTVKVNVNPTPQLSVGSSSVDICNGQSTNLTASATGGTSAYTYTWSPSTGLSSTTGTPVTANPSTTTTYTVTVTDAKGCTDPSGSKTVKVNVNPTPQLSVGSSSVDICNGQSTNLTASATGGTSAYTFTWSPSTGLSSTTGTPVTANPTTTTTYTVTVTDAKGCTDPSGSKTVKVNVNPTPQLSVGSSSVDICNGQSASLTASATGGTSTYTFTWSPSAGLSSTTGTPVTANPTSTTTYTVTVTDAKGCADPNGSKSVKVNVNSNPVASAGSASYQVCPGGSVQINTTVSAGTGPFTYSWTPSSTLDDNTIAKPTASPAINTTYTLVITDSKGCSNSALPLQVPVTISNGLSVSAGNVPYSFCEGSSVQISTTVTGGTTPYTYSWSPSTGLNRTDIGDPTVSSLSSGNYTFTLLVSDSKGCSNSSNPLNVPVTVNQNPSANPSITGPATICKGETSQLNANASNGASPYTYSWTPGTMLNDNTSANPIATPDQAGTFTYTVVVKDANGCTNPNSAQVTLTVNPIPDNENISGQNPVCEATSGLQYSVTSVTGMSYNWNVPSGATLVSGQGSESITVDFAQGASSGNITVIRTTNLGCSDPAPLSLTVNVNPRPTVSPTTATPGPICLGSSIQLEANASNGTGPYSYSWTPSATLDDNTLANPQATPDQIGSITYTVVVTDAKQCANLNPAQVTIDVNSLPSSITVSGNDHICGGTPSSVYSVSPNAGSTYDWSASSGVTITSGQGSASITVDFASNVTDGTIQVIETNSNSCSSASANVFNFSVNPATPVAAVVSPDRNICSGLISISAVPASSGITGIWTVSSGSATIYNNNSDTTTAYSFNDGQNILRWTLSGPCGVSYDSIIVNVGAQQISVSAKTSEDTLCLGSSAQIEVTVNGSTATPFTYTWISSDGSLNSITKENPVSVNLISNGWVKYFVDVLDMNGCSTGSTLVDSLFGVAPQTLNIPNLITPNGDYKNDCWEITDVNTNVNIIPGSLLEIYNRWGDRVYLNKAYKNGDFCGSVLADGIYFYSLKPVCGIKSEEKGWLQIISNTESSNK